jgi:hypothetical protein
LRFTNPPSRLDAIDFRHLCVHQDKRIVLPLHGGDRLATVADEVGRVAQIAQLQ